MKEFFTFKKMTVGPWASEGGALHPWILKFSATKGYFLSFEREKLNFSTFGPPLEKF